jgi:hypothetical protein
MARIPRVPDVGGQPPGRAYVARARLLSIAVHALDASIVPNHVCPGRKPSIEVKSPALLLPIPSGRATHSKRLDRLEAGLAKRIRVTAWSLRRRPSLHSGVERTAFVA